MSNKQPRLELQIDIFTLKKQRALILPSVMPTELVASVLQEFGGTSSSSEVRPELAPEKYQKLEYLSHTAEGYQLLKANGGQPLNPSITLGNQVAPNELLVLVEVDAPLPPNTTRPSRPVYLSEQGKNKVYKVNWLPALIGRPDPNLPYNDRLAVNLADHVTGQRVSRRHAQLVEVNNRIFLECLSPNPLLVVSQQGTITQVEHDRYPLAIGDTIILERSEIALKFIVPELGPVAK